MISIRITLPDRLLQERNGKTLGTAWTTPGCKLLRMDDNKLKEILNLLHLQKEALTELAVELMTRNAMSRDKAGISAQKAIIFRAKIEQQVRRLAEQQA
jgi:hypothetical protein